MRISDWSSDVCSSDLGHPVAADLYPVAGQGCQGRVAMAVRRADRRFLRLHRLQLAARQPRFHRHQLPDPADRGGGRSRPAGRSEEHTSELQSLMSISYAVFCLKKKQQHQNTIKEVNKETSR